MAFLNNSILTLQTCTPHQHEGTTNFKPADSFLPPSNFLTRIKSSTRTRSLSSKTSQSFTSIINEFEKEKINKSIDQLEESVNTRKIYEPELVDRWLEIHGQDDWVGMLDPMDPILHNELIRYGEMAQACYDAFDFDPYSKYCGSCKFPRRKFFDGLGMAEYGYDITRYLYATSNINLPNFFKQSRWPKIWSKNANWIGYVAVSNDETSKRLGRRDITIAWRGTVTRLEWIADLMDYLRPISSDNIPCPDPNVKVESGFLDLYTDKDEKCRYCKFSAREQILTEVKRLIEMYPDEEMSITVIGHNLGSALAILSAYDIVETGLNVKADTSVVPICVFSFSGPRVGNVRFKERIEKLGVKVLRVVNVHDIVPKSPGLVLNEHSPSMVMKICEKLPQSYSHVGVELALDHKNSPFLKPTSDLVCAHNLEAHLHLLDGCMDDIYDALAEHLVSTAAAASASASSPYFKHIVGLAGPPGAGKSTVASEVAKRVNKIWPQKSPSFDSQVEPPEVAIVLPMDGFHLYRHQLDAMEDPEEAHARRGAPWTFDPNLLLECLKTLKDQGSVYCPSFDHGVGDPIEDDIFVNLQHKIVIVEGNYLLLGDGAWKEVSSMFDEKWFVDVDLEKAMQRVLKRHISTGKSPDVAKWRIDYNDRPNAELIMKSKNNADLVIKSIDELR